MMQNLAPGIDYVTISIVRPLQMCPIPPRPDDSLIRFSRAEYTLLVVSGLYAALRAPHGWRDWEEATAHRAPIIREKDHLLVIASLLSQGRDLGQTYEYLPGHQRAAQAMRRLSEAAALWRAQEDISTPLTVFPDGAVSWGTPPPARVSCFHEGRLWVGGRLPDPGFEAPLLEHAVDGTHVETLVDLAKHGEEATFKDLAQTLGVPAEKLDELWTGTVRRLSRGLE